MATNATENSLNGLDELMKNVKSNRGTIENVQELKVTIKNETKELKYGEKPHTCYYCGKSFSLRCNLIRHTRIHTDEKRFSCDQCSRRFILKKNLIEHQRIHTGEKPFICTSCNWLFDRQSSLKRHIRIHTGEKNYECNICKKTFAWKYYLHRHIHVHFPQKRASGSENGPTLEPVRKLVTI